jgi:hypothetical protein
LFVSNEILCHTLPLTPQISSVDAVCALPVAKRNFLLRHGHGLFQSSKELKEEVDEVSESLLEEDSCQPCAESSNQNEKPRHRRVVSFDGSKRLHGTHLDADERKWLDLLNQRPDTDEPMKMAEWIDEIMNVSARKLAQSKSGDNGPIDAAKPLDEAGIKAAVGESGSISSKAELDASTKRNQPVWDAESSEYATLFEDIDINHLFDFEQESNEIVAGIGIELGNQTH